MTHSLSSAARPLFALGTLIVLSSTAAAGGQPPTTHRIPLQMVGRYAVVSADIAGRQEPLRLIVDTAAGATVLDSTLAERLGLVDQRTTQAHVAGASGSAHDVRVARTTSITMAGATFEVTPLLTDVSRISHGDAGDENRYDGILGNDLLRRFDVRFDVGAGVLQLSEPGSPSIDANSLQCQANAFGTARAPHLQGFAMVDVAASSQAADAQAVALKAVIDTGAAQTLFNWAAIEKLGYRRDDPRLRKRDGGTVGFSGQGTDTYLTTVDQLGYGAWKARHIQVRVADLPVFQSLGLGEQPAIILGIDALQAAPLTISKGVTRICVGPLSPGETGLRR